MKFQSVFGSLLVALASISSVLGAPAVEAPSVNALERRDERSAAGQYLYDAADAVGLAHTLQPRMVYAMKEACKNPINGIHCRLLVGQYDFNAANELHWGPTRFYDLIYEPTDNTRTKNRDFLWTPAIGGQANSKYTPEFLGRVRNDMGVDDIKTISDILIAENPVYCRYTSIVPGLAPANSANCFSFTDMLWERIKL